MGTWSTASKYAEGEWRWHNDQAAVEQEVRQSENARDARRTAEQKRHESRLRTLTWDKLLQEQSFSRWNAHPPFPPPEFVIAARQRIRDAVLRLKGLGQRPTKREVRAILKSLVEWFNLKDQEYGEIIETEERDDICEVLYELAWVAGHRSLMTEIHEWRRW